MRKRRGLTQTQVADRMGISVARVSQFASRMSGVRTF
ncbi:helix-turn-helix domain-containing protein [Streptosporangium vulgare]|uniref:Helix-turn-helix domain-containing protein n=1 Tax=Streptosporangium vulgare TaxID=46190 RepID=A0ABV5TCR1_9ACTN